MGSADCLIRNKEVIDSREFTLTKLTRAENRQEHLNQLGPITSQLFKRLLCWSSGAWLFCIFQSVSAPEFRLVFFWLVLLQ